MAKPKILLLIEREGHERRIEEFEDNIIKIGKLSSVNLRLDDPHINRIHAVIEIAGQDDAQIIDMGSSRGTKVNDKRIHKSKIVTGDKVLLGDTLLTVFLGEEAVSRARLGDFSLAASAAPASSAAPSLDLSFGDSGPFTPASIAGSGSVDVDLAGSLYTPEDDAFPSESTQITKNPAPSKAPAPALMPSYDSDGSTAMVNASLASEAINDPSDTAQVSEAAAAQVREASYQAGYAPAPPAYPPADPYAQSNPYAQPNPYAPPPAPAYNPPPSAFAPAPGYPDPYAQPQNPPAPDYSQFQPPTPMAGGFATPPQAPSGFAAPHPYAPPPVLQPTGAAPAFAMAQALHAHASPSPSYAAPVAEPMGMGDLDKNFADSQEALEIRILWGDTVLDHAHFYNPKKITIGESRKNTFSLSSEALPEGMASFTLIETQNDRLLVHFTDHMQGTIQIKDQAFTLDQIKQSAKVERTSTGFQFALPAQSQVALQLGQITFQISFVPAPKRIGPAFLAQMDHHFARAMGASFLIHGILILFMLFADEAPQGLDDSFFKQNNRFAQLIVRPEEPEEEKKKKKDSGAAKAMGKEGKMGKKPKPDEKIPPDLKRRAGQIEKNPDGTAPIDLKKVEKDLTSKIEEKMGKLGLFGANNKAMASLMDAKGFGGDDSSALGNILGSKVGEASGAGGLGLRAGGGQGGGGLSGSFAGLGNLGTYGRGGGKGGRGWGDGKLRNKARRNVGVDVGPPVVFGSLDKEIIRRIINQHRNQIKYCYEKELLKQPNLQGTIKVFFRIEGDGRVSESKVRQTTMNNDRVEECLASRVRFMRFPAPKGGGIVDVNYPFYFKPS